MFIVVFLVVFLHLIFPNIVLAHEGAFSTLNHLGPQTIAASVTAASIDAFNPTSIGVLLFLLQARRKQFTHTPQIIRTGLLYVVGLISMYLIAGFAINLILVSSGATLWTETLQLLLAFLLFLTGLHEFLFAIGKQQLLPQTSGFIEQLYHRVGFFVGGLWPFFLGLTMAIFELFLTGAVYLNFVRLITFDPTVHTGVLATFIAIYLFVFSLPLFGSIFFTSISNNHHGTLQGNTAFSTASHSLIGLVLMAVSIWLTVNSINIILTLE